jgi:hypothetical protein
MYAGRRGPDPRMRPHRARARAGRLTRFVTSRRQPGTPARSGMPPRSRVRRSYGRTSWRCCALRPGTQRPVGRDMPDGRLKEPGNSAHEHTLRRLRAPEGDQRRVQQNRRQVPTTPRLFLASLGRGQTFCAPNQASVRFSPSAKETIGSLPSNCLAFEMSACDSRRIPGKPTCSRRSRATTRPSAASASRRASGRARPR